MKITIEQGQNCGGCKHFEQGPNCSFCSHPKQTDSSIRRYAYWNFGTECQLFEAGIHPGRKRLTPHATHKINRWSKAFKRWWSDPENIKYKRQPKWETR